MFPFLLTFPLFESRFVGHDSKDKKYSRNVCCTQKHVSQQIEKNGRTSF